MIESIIAKRYARALIGLAKKENQVEPIDHEFSAFVEQCQLNKILIVTLANSGFELQKRLNVLDEITSRLGLSAILLKLLKLLLKKNRLPLLQDIYAAYHDLANQTMKRSIMTVITASELPTEQYKELEEHFAKATKKTMILKKQIEPQVLGGVLVKINDNIYDYTLKKQLEDIKQKMIQ